MEKIIPNGTEVLIIPSLDVNKFIKGKIISSKMSEDISDRAWPEHVTIYTVRDETGEEYTATYGTFVLGVSCYAIRTIEDHVEKMQREIKSNEVIIEKVQNKNNLLQDKIKELLGEEIGKNARVWC